jgi:general secretion pathway protein B
MSFILDALKKSEVERQRQTVPGLMDSGRVPPRPRFPPWAIALGALLVINLIVLAVVLLRRENQSLAPATGSAARGAAPSAARVYAPAAVPHPPPVVSPPAEGANHFSPMDGTPTYAPEIPMAAVESARAPEPTPAREKPATHRSEPSLEAPVEQDEVLPTIGELNLTGPDALPELHLDVHVYATIPADRFVYVNNRKYREGMRLQEGPTVERIRRDGVVLNSQGTRFLLPREQ